MTKKELIVGNYYYYEHKYYKLNSIIKDRVYFGTKNEWGFCKNTTIKDFLYSAIPEKQYVKPAPYKEPESNEEEKLIDAIVDHYEREGI